MGADFPPGWDMCRDCGRAHAVTGDCPTDPCDVNLTGDPTDPVICASLSDLPHHECGEHHDETTTCAEAGRAAEDAMMARLVPR